MRGRGSAGKARGSSRCDPHVEPGRRRLRRLHRHVRCTRLRAESRVVGGRAHYPPRVTQRLLIAAWSVALAAAAAAMALVLSRSHEDDPAARAGLIVGVGLIFVGCGLVAMVRRPDNRTGFLMALVGYFFFLSALADANNATVYTIGVALSLLVYGAFAHLILSFPTGRLETPRDRAIVILAYLDVTV